MDKTYTPDTIEQNWYTQWEQKNYFRAQGEGQPYCIMLPPPNVTGSLHMGHGFQHTLMDALIRYHRMLGDKTLWQPGTDHAGISTQLVVERQLEAVGQSRKDMTREQFLEHVWAWKAHSGTEITRQMRRIGSSCDWTRERFTMDEGLSEAVLDVFISLYNEGLIYRGTRLVNWDPKLGTAVSDLEVVPTDEEGQMWHIAYPLADGTGQLVVATTRPETLLGDVAVAVSPQDERYKHLIGQSLALPLCDRLIPIIADDYVDEAFGSGCVKITPAHDFNDHDVAKRHNLAPINIFTKKATINKNAPIAYQGMDRFVAREKILEDLKALNLLVKVEPHALKIPRGEKSGVIIEPLLTDQWYVKMKPLAAPAIEAVQKGEIRFIPENWTKTYFQWMENIEDWCISRQLWWGHRIPAWYDSQGRIYVGKNEAEIRARYALADTIALKQDEDVLDTWFSSALWPFTTLGWPEKTEALENFYPTQVLVTGFDIIFFWVARMVMMGLKFTGQVPFREVYITGLIRDSEGQKMSKSKGNVLDPIDIIDGIDLDSLVNKRTSNLVLTSVKDKIAKATKKEFPEGIPAYGTDALRFTYCALASNGRNVRFDLGRVEGYRNFCNKIWNATRYVLMNTEEERGDFGDSPLQFSPQDEWILSRLQKVIAQTHQHYQEYRFDLLANGLYDFIWHEYCDWYLELVKPVLQNDGQPALKRGAQFTLIQVLTKIIQLLHPLMPFITEEIWQRVYPLSQQASSSVMLSSYPAVEDAQINEPLEAEILWLQNVIQSIRTIRSEMNVSPAKTIPLVVRSNSEKTLNCLIKYEGLLKALSKISDLNVLALNESAPVSATAVVEDLEIFIPMAGLIDVKAELERLDKELLKLEKEITISTNKLSNPQFSERAPVEVIKKEQDRLLQAQQTKDKLKTQKDYIARMP